MSRYKLDDYSCQRDVMLSLISQNGKGVFALSPGERVSTSQVDQADLQGEGSVRKDHISLL